MLWVHRAWEHSPGMGRVRELVGWVVGLAIPVGMVGIFLARAPAFAIALMGGVLFFVISWARTPTQFVTQSGLDKTDDLGRADDTDQSAVFGGDITRDWP